MWVCVWACHKSVVHFFSRFTGLSYCCRDWWFPEYDISWLLAFSSLCKTANLVSVKHCTFCIKERVNFLSFYQNWVLCICSEDSKIWRYSFHVQTDFSWVLAKIDPAGVSVPGVLRVRSESYRLDVFQATLYALYKPTSSFLQYVPAMRYLIST